MSDIVSAFAAEYRRYKALADAAIAQLEDGQLSQPGPAGNNSIAVLVWHVSGNLRSRFSEFRTADGEKPWRDRDDEFVLRTVTRPELLERWEGGWRELFAAIGPLTNDDLDGTVTIRGQSLSIEQALMRSLGHTVYHVGQILYLAKSMRGGTWENLSIPPGASAAYNRSPVLETAAAHAQVLGGGLVAEPAVEIAADSAEAQALMQALDAEMLQRYPGWPTHGLDERDRLDSRTVFMVIRARGEAVACGATRVLADGTFEVKRMYVRPDFRGRGLARRILGALEASARRQGATRLVLETGSRQPEAVALYVASGFAAIEPYGQFTGDPHSRCFEKTLAP